MVYFFVVFSRFSFSLPPGSVGCFRGRAEGLFRISHPLTLSLSAILANMLAKMVFWHYLLYLTFVVNSRL
jgi:hypothetical protein